MATAAQTNKDVVRRYLNAFNDRNWEALRELLDDDVVEHGIHDELQGPEDVLEYLQQHFEMFPDYSGETEGMVAEGDTVVVRYSVTGTHSGEYKDVEATGLAAEWTGMAMYRVEDERIAEVWLEEDRLGLLEQLEVVEPPAHLRL